MARKIKKKAVKKKRPRAKKCKFTLSDLLDPLNLAEYLDWPFEATEETVPRGMYGGCSYTKKVNAEQVIKNRWERYVYRLFEDWLKSRHNPYKPQTYSQFIDECARKGLGITQGTLEQKVQKAFDLRPDLYIRHEDRHDLVRKEVANPSFKQNIIDAKARHPNMLCIFRVGDFYEAYDQDALVVGAALILTMTRRLDMAMVSFPHHSLEKHLHTLLKANHRVAICDYNDLGASTDYHPEGTKP